MQARLRRDAGFAGRSCAFNDLAVILRAAENERGERKGVSRMVLDFFYQPERISVRFTENCLENRVLTHCG